MGKQIQRSITGKIQKEVSQKLREMAMAVDKSTYQAPSRLTVKEWLETWQKDYLGNVKASTAHLYGRNIDLYVIPRLGAVKLEALTAPIVQRLYNDLLNPTGEDINPLSAKTVRNIHGVLHKALKQAVQVGYLRTNPADACKLPKRKCTPLMKTSCRFFKSYSRAPL